MVKESSFKYHKEYKIYPAKELDYDTALSFRGAQYHLNRFKSLLGSPNFLANLKGDASQQTNPIDDEWNQLHWHLRGFFWEMVATFDTMLQWANQRYELGLSEPDVKWRKIPKKAGRDQSTWDKKYGLLKSAYESDWFFEVRAYRNYAHWGLLLFVVDYSEQRDGEKIIRKINAAKLLSVRDAQSYTEPVEQLTNYWLEVQNLGKSLFAD